MGGQFETEWGVSLVRNSHKVKEIGLETEFIRVPEAMEYRETIAMLSKLNSTEQPNTIEQIVAEEFPTSLT